MFRWIIDKNKKEKNRIKDKGLRENSLVHLLCHAFFLCQIVRPLCKLIECYTKVRILREQFFVLEASSVCNNEELLLETKKYYVF